MAEKSFNGIVDTNGEWDDLATVTGITFANDVMYTIYVGGNAWVKAGDAEFPATNQKIYWTPTSGNTGLKIKNITNPMTISIYGAS